MDQGCECISMVQNEKELEPLYLILAAMSIAKNHHEELEMIRQLPNDVTLDRISAGLRPLMADIVTILRHSNEKFELYPIDEVLKEYLLDVELDPPYIAKLSNKFSKDFHAASKCYQVLIAMYYETNREFFTKLLEGFNTIRDIINIDCNEELGIFTPADKVKRDELTVQFHAIVDQVTRCRLEDPDPNFKKADLEGIVEALNENNQEALDAKFKASKTRAFLFLILVGVCFTGALLWTRGA